MAIQIQEGFSVGSPPPLAARTIVDTIADRDLIRPYDGMVVYVKQEKQHYLYDNAWDVWPKFVQNDYKLIKETLSIVTAKNNQKEFDIPMENYNKDVHFFDVVIGSVFYSNSRYTIQNNKIILNANEDGIEKDRRVDFIFVYIDIERKSVV